MLSQNLRNYFHLVVKAQQKSYYDGVLSTPLVDFGQIRKIGVLLIAFNWDVEIAVLKTKIDYLESKPRTQKKLLSIDERIRLGHALRHSSYENNDVPKNDKEVAGKMIEFLEDAVGTYREYESFLPHFKDAYNSWNNLNPPL